MCAAQNVLWGWNLDRYVFSVSWGRRLDPPILEHAVLKEFCMCPALALLMVFTLLHFFKFFFSLELYNVTDFSPCTYQLCQEYLAVP